MKIKLIRRYETDKSTIGKLLVDGKFICYTLEDIGRKIKVFGKTRIWAGTYQIKLRKVGGFHNRYKKRFPDMHEGMLQITNVRKFKYILIHIGNTANDTNGCILVGTGMGKDYISDSTNAYKRLYPIVLNALQSGDTVTIEITEDKIIRS